jgi:2-polyprenyl-3-methyl-5-hydroxy-6-metoxy-1,4-benzoquinol methylase
MTIQYGWLPGGLIGQAFLQECADLYSEHYGIWSAVSPVLPGQRIRFSATKLKRLLSSRDSRIYYARADDQLIAYAALVQTKVNGRGIVTWVTQFVVHEAYRNQRIGTKLLFTIWGMSDHWAWGLVSANPYAIRALEKATRRRCSTDLICERMPELVELGAAHVPYISGDLETGQSENRAALNTRFFVDHSSLLDKIRSVESERSRWLLGGLSEGWEWCAFVFNEQDQIQLAADEIDGMVEASDQITAQAYSRMVLSPDQKWLRHTDTEVQRIVEYCGLRVGDSVLDIGCGNGRHAIGLAARGIETTAIDYVESLVVQARSAGQSARRVEFECADVRHLTLEKRFDSAICLYDVIGTYIDNADNCSILQSIYRHLRPGGRALISVMNFELTESAAVHRFSLQDQPGKLLTLPPSGTMETSGDVFKPNFYMIDTRDQGVVYRREQFSQGESLPIELLVRDRRFRKSEIETMCIDAGFEIVWSRYVRAGAWEKELTSTDPQAKEILLLCRRPPAPAALRENSVAGYTEPIAVDSSTNRRSFNMRNGSGRRKKIARGDMIGQAGVNLIATIVNSMGFLWHPTGLEAGIDGYIEIRDSSSGEVTNCIIQVQSRATEKPFQGETVDGFDYLCDERDLTYWLGGNAPVILVRSRPSTDEAYWVSIKDYFRTPENRASRKIHFDKQNNRFDASCAVRLATAAIPADSGIYLARPPRTETLFANLLELVDYWPYVFRAPTDFRKPGPLWQRLRDFTSAPASEWILDDCHIYSLVDLKVDPWPRICDAEQATQLPTSQFATALDAPTRNLFVRLLNQSLRALLHREEVAFNGDKECYYFRAMRGLRARRYGGRTVVSVGQSRTDPARAAYYRHMAFNGQFLRYDQKWYLEITPTYLFTFDGRSVSRRHDELLSGIKQLEVQNKTHLSQVRLWANLLAPRESLYETPYKFIRFGGLPSFDVNFGIDDAGWLPEPARLGQPAPQQRTFIE